jgi:hypothetical protein
MVIGTRGLVLFSFLVGFCLTSNGMLAAGVSAGTTITHHDLSVQIDPATHALIAQDLLTLDVAQSFQPIRLSLAPTLTVDRLALTSGNRPVDDPAREIPFEVEHGPEAHQAQHLTIPPAVVTAGTMTIKVRYHGVIDDPPKEPRHLRFVTPSETAGHIGQEGVYLSSESRWYPDLPDSLSRFRLHVTLPEGWTAVTQGKARATTTCSTERCPQGTVVTEWDLMQPSEALTLVANRFVVKTREWTAGGGQAVQLAAYLFPEDAALADEYLDATARYLGAYIPLLGPYPFETFAVVENFFASGLGMPSFTLLGGGIIKRHYVQPYALGHEIVHSWIGNAVFNRIDRGNWVEGLTTYLANYYWHELSGEQAQALDQRRLMVRGYNLHVPPGRDYPVGQFTQKQDERDNAVGYQKSSMVFHLLRQEVGEDLFWSALKRLVAQYRGRHAEWYDLEQTFTAVAGRDLRWFFAQWVEQDGAPSFSITEAVAHQIHKDGVHSYQFNGTIAQTGDRIFRVSVPLRIRMEDGKEQVLSTSISNASQTVTAALPARPLWVELDPDMMVLRRIARRALPPVLNHYVTDTKRSVLLAFADTPTNPHPFREIVKRIEGQESRKSPAERTTVGRLPTTALLPQDGSVLVLAGPESRAAMQKMLAGSCGDHIGFHDNGVIVNGLLYEGPGVAALVSCHRGDRPGSVVTLLYATTPQAAATVSRLLFFYGWHSFVVFRDGAVVTRGEWPETSDRTEVRIDGRAVVR